MNTLPPPELHEFELDRFPDFLGGPEWTAEDSHEAIGEGWDIFECSGSISGPWQIQRDDDLEVFPDDSDVHEWVWRQACLGSALHAKAIEFVKYHNRPEYDLIEKVGLFHARRRAPTR